MIHLTEEMSGLVNRARENGTPCILASASADGVPNAGYRGTMMVFDEGSLAYRERSDLSPIEHIEKNPKAVVLFYDPGQQKGWKFRCTPSIHREGPIFERVMARLAELGLIQGPETTGVAVVLQVDQILTQFGELLQERIPGLRW